ncbi:MAG: PilZ domain-containing protein [Crocosphaera sp.]|nr:PilZ domain-containing protein [Crocosphaera sp.]
MFSNSDNLDTQVTELLPLKLHQRKTKRLGINKGQFVKLVFKQKQVYSPCKATIIDDSFNGCGLLVKSNEKVKKGQKVLILIENMEPIKAQIMWIQPVDDHRFRMGVKYLSSKSLKTKLFFQKTNSNNN